MTILNELLIKAGPEFACVVPFMPLREKLVFLDFTERNEQLTASIISDTRIFTDYIDGQLAVAAAVYGIGGYNEHRTVYSRSIVFDATTNDEPRRLHLGTDIWGKAGTNVMAPLSGTVHSFAFNNRFGDYGATIILRHSIHEYDFYTLYGHLSLESIQDLSVEQKIEKGQTFSAFGIPAENGNWPPHLHFQIIDDIGDWGGDYPGVCAYSEREKYLANSPDADLILQMNKYAFYK